LRVGLRAEQTAEILTDYLMPAKGATVRRGLSRLSRYRQSPEITNAAQYFGRSRLEGLAFSSEISRPRGGLSSLCSQI
jgi:hypothetical protein